jgi:hypothetical protein
MTAAPAAKRVPAADFGPVAPPTGADSLFELGKSPMSRYVVESSVTVNMRRGALFSKRNSERLRGRQESIHEICG